MAQVARNERNMRNHLISGGKIDAQVVVVAIGGFDPGGGAGVVRDFLTARTLGAAVRLIPTAWTEQSAAGVQRIEPRKAAALVRAVRGALAPTGRSAGEPPTGEARLVVKIGMLPDDRAIDAVLNGLGSFGGPVVLDPVLAASSGGEPLYRGDPEALLAVGARSALMTPNALETEVLTGLTVRTVEDADAAARALCALGAGAVLVKGGHLVETDAIDVLVTGGQTRCYAAARLQGPSVRGTGCALATAIAVGLGRGLVLADAIAWAKTWLLGALAGAVDVGGERHLS